MEDDRVLVDVGIAAEIEESHISQNAVKQPKRRFVGRRTAEATAKAAPQSSSSIEDSGAIQGIFIYQSTMPSCCSRAATDTSTQPPQLPSQEGHPVC